MKLWFRDRFVFRTTAGYFSPTNQPTITRVLCAVECAGRIAPQRPTNPAQPPNQSSNQPILGWLIDVCVCVRVVVHVSTWDCQASIWLNTLKTTALSTTPTKLTTKYL